MVNLSDLDKMSVTTARDDVPEEFLGLEDLDLVTAQGSLIFPEHVDMDLITAKSWLENPEYDEFDLMTAQAIDETLPPEQITKVPEFYIGVSTEEDGQVWPFNDAYVENKLIFPLADFNLCVRLVAKEDDVTVYINSEARDSVEWSVVAQVRFRVGVANANQPMRVVDGDVFRFGPYAAPISVKIGHKSLFRFAIEMRYIYKAKMSGNEIVPLYSNSNSLPTFDIPNKGTIKLVLPGRQTYYPDFSVMTLHNLTQFGRGYEDEYFPRITVELRKELAKNDLRADDLIHALLCYIHPPHQPVQEKFIRPLLIFAHDHLMNYVFNAMENALITVPPFTPRILLDMFALGEKWALVNLIRNSLVRIEVTYHDIANEMCSLPTYSSLSAGLRETIEDRLKNGWARQIRRLGERAPTDNVNRIVYLTEGGVIPKDENDLHTFAEVNSAYAFSK